MQNRIDLLFAKKAQGIVSIFVTAGFPTLEDTVPICTTLLECGADMIELGMPFSDPVADGPIIQESSMFALKHGMNIEKILEHAKLIREKSNAPLLLMGYLNPVMQYGFENFLKGLERSGIDGVIIPDLPPEEYERCYVPLFEKYKIYNILLVAPNTSTGRLNYLDKLSQGFLYVVSSLSTTGGVQRNLEARSAYLRKLKDMNLKNPLVVGFGIKTRDDLKEIHESASGAIIGSAFIEAISSTENTIQTTKDFMRNLK